MSNLAARAIKFGSFAVVCSGLAMGFAAPASATTTLTVTDVQDTGNDYTVGILNPKTNQVEDAYDTALIFTINGHQVLVNCDDLWHNISLGVQNLTFTVNAFSSSSQPVPNPSGGTYSTTQINQMSWLLDESDEIWTGALKPASGTVEQNLAALQLASWMVGNPGTTYTPSSTAVADLAQNYALTSVGQKSLTGHVEQLLSMDGVQAQLFDPVLTPVPEPSIWAMLLLGFGSIGFSARTLRRRQKAALAG